MTDNQDRMAQALLAAKTEFDFLVQKRTFDVTDRERWRALANVIQAAIAHASAQPAQPASVAYELYERRARTADDAARAKAILTHDEYDLLLAATGFCAGNGGRSDPLRMDKAVALIWRLAAAPQPPSAMAQDAREQCVWSEDADGNWETGCGRMFVLNDGTPYDNEMGFCCYCGHSINQVSYGVAQESGDDR